MPYINPGYRGLIDDEIDGLIQKIKDTAPTPTYVDGSPGILNYACTRLALGLIPERRYWAIAMVSGVFHNIADEFYRRYAVPYENEQIEKNGDVY